MAKITIIQALKKLWNAATELLAGKQDKLRAGSNIIINGNTISAIIDAGFNVEIVQTFPEKGEINTIYFIQKVGAEKPDVYDEYMYINSAWEKIGSTEVDLSNYYNKTEVDDMLATKQATLTPGNNITINGSTISANDTTYSASDNIDITNNAIKAVGYRYNTANGAFAEGDRDIVVGETTSIKSTATGRMSHAEGCNTSATGHFSHAEGQETTASGYYSHSEGYKSKAQYNVTHAEGNSTIASGDCAHSEGYSTKASGSFTHAEGISTIAKGTASHAEGDKTTANGINSHAEGGYTIANGGASHSEGRFTQTLNNGEHAEGSYNISHKATDGFNGNAGNTLHSIGIGTADAARKNAVEVMQNGDAYLLGVGNYDGAHIKGETGAPSGLQTLQEVVSGLRTDLENGLNECQKTVYPYARFDEVTGEVTGDYTDGGEYYNEDESYFEGNYIGAYNGNGGRVVCVRPWRITELITNDNTGVPIELLLVDPMYNSEYEWYANREYIIRVVCDGSDGNLSVPSSIRWAKPQIHRDLADQLGISIDDYAYMPPLRDGNTYDIHILNGVAWWVETHNA